MTVLAWTDDPADPQYACSQACLHYLEGETDAQGRRIRVECEFGATAGKVELAKVAKKNNLDAIHDTVHEMARDEARHGKAFEGLLNRYFGK